MDEDELVNLFKLVTGITNVLMFSANVAQGVTKSYECLYMILNKDGQIEWYVDMDRTNIQDIMDKNLPNETKLELVLRYG